MDTKDSNGMSVTIMPQFKDKVVDEIESELDIRDSYRFDLLISKNNHTKNLSSRNLINVLANLFSDLSPTSMNFCSSLVFPISSSYLAISDGISGCKALDSISFVSLATCNPGNIFIFYH